MACCRTGTWATSPDKLSVTKSGGADGGTTGGVATPPSRRAVSSVSPDEAALTSNGTSNGTLVGGRHILSVQITKLIVPPTALAPTSASVVTATSVQKTPSFSK